MSIKTHIRIEPRIRPPFGCWRQRGCDHSPSPSRNFLSISGLRYAIRDESIEPLRFSRWNRVVNTLDRAIPGKTVGVEREPCVRGERRSIFHPVHDIRGCIPAKLNLRHPDAQSHLLCLDSEVKYADRLPRTIPPGTNVIHLSATIAPLCCCSGCLTAGNGHPRT